MQLREGTHFRPVAVPAELCCHADHLLPTPGLLSALPMFGSSFFFVQSCSSVAVPAPCILAVNQNGLNFLSTETHVSGLSLVWPLAPSPPRGQGSQRWKHSSTLTTCVTLGKSLALSEPHFLMWNMGIAIEANPWSCAKVR